MVFRIVTVLILFILQGCVSFLREANEFKGAVRLDFTAPIDWIPGISSILPHIVFDITGGFEWHNDAQAQDHELALARIRSKLEDEDEIDIKAVFLAALRGDTATTELR